MVVNNINPTAVNPNTATQVTAQKVKVEIAQPKKEEVALKHETIRLNDALEALSRAANIFNKRLQFSVDLELNRVVVKIIDEKTDKVIKQIPPDEVLNFVSELRKMIGVFIDKQQ